MKKVSAIMTACLGLAITTAFTGCNQFGNDFYYIDDIEPYMTDKVKYVTANPCDEKITVSEDGETINFWNVKYDGALWQLFPETVESLDLRGFDFSSQTDWTSAFNDLTNLTYINLSHMDGANVTSMNGMFANCESLEEIDLSHMNLKSVENLSLLFAGCKNLKSVKLPACSAEKVEDTTQMFYACEKLETIDLSTLKFRDLKKICGMFSSCETLKTVKFPDMSKVMLEDISHVFEECTLTSLDLSGWNTSKVKDMSYAFVHNEHLTNLNLSGWDTSSCEDMNYMFESIGHLSDETFALNLSSFDTSKVKTMTLMFGYTDMLQTVYVSDKFVTTALTEEAKAEDIFFNNRYLKGAREYGEPDLYGKYPEGTVNDYTMANYTTGYFTEKK